jgi:hypothetical protein
MRILLVTQYFWPESFAINEMVRKISDAGHHVTVLTGKPNYPDGKIFPGYTQHGIIHETYADNVKVFRVPLRPRNENRALDLVRNYVSFVFSGLRHFHRLTKAEKYDLVFALQLSPITSVIPAIYLSWRRNIPLVTWVQDLWPESLSATGHIRNRAVLWCVGILVHWIYKCCDMILVSSRAFTAHVQKFAPRSNILYYGVSIDTENNTTGKKTPALRAKITKYFSQRHFNVLFAGNIGTAQAVETLLEAAVLLRGVPQFRLVFAGSGSMLPWLEKRSPRTASPTSALPGAIRSKTCRSYTPLPTPCSFR